MPDFSRSEYASYVQLCRELRLEREWRDGDWCWCSTHQDPVGFICLNYDWQDPIDRTQMPDFWLPSLADWLEMLEAADWPEVTIGPVLTGGYIAVGVGRQTRTRPNGKGSTREEAAARLWLAVTQPPADPSPSSAAR